MVKMIFFRITKVVTLKCQTFYIKMSFGLLMAVATLLFVQSFHTDQISKFQNRAIDFTIYITIFHFIYFDKFCVLSYPILSPKAATYSKSDYV